MRQGGAADRWATAISKWAIPKEILDRAPESPWALPPALFTYHPQAAADTPSHRRALEGLPRDGTVLDVGVGGGAASLPLAHRCSSVAGVDQSTAMLETFRLAAEAAGVAHLEIQGNWPDVAGQAPITDLAVCHNVFYNVPDLVPFAAALTAHARSRVVVEMTINHPVHDLNRLWLHFHGITFPDEPTADDARAVLNEMGLNASIERWERPPRYRASDRAEVVAFVRRRLCLPVERDQEINRLLGSDPFVQPRQVATLWWEPGPQAGLESRPCLMAMNSSRRSRMSITRCQV